MKRKENSQWCYTPEILFAELKLRPTPQVALHARFVTTTRSNEIAVFHIVHEAADITLLWSHGNAMDCGELLGFLQDLAARLNVSIVVYDYAGCWPGWVQPCSASPLL